MESEQILNEALVKWDEGREQGKRLTPPEIIPEHRALWDHLESEIRRIEKLERQFPTAAANRTKADEQTGGSAAEEDTWLLPIAMQIEPDRFDIVRKIDKGGMGVVFQAWDKKLKRNVAIKMILAGQFATTKQLLQFDEEAQRIARFQHPNIVQVFDIGRLQDFPYLVMEYVDGGTLADKIRHAPYQPKTAAQIVETLARAMHQAHKQMIVHRDLKPLNILLRRDGTPKIADFGMAREFGDITHSHTTIAGTPSYMSPEQAHGKKTDERGDVYALGVILYEMLSGQPPFRGQTAAEILERVRNEEAAPLQQNHDVPNDLETICLKCLQKEPTDRYESAEALAEDLARFQKGQVPQGRLVSTSERVWRWCMHPDRAQEVGIATSFMAVLLSVMFVGVVAFGVPYSRNFEWHAYAYPPLMIVLFFVPLFFIGLGVVRKKLIALIGGAAMGFFGVCTTIWFFIPPRFDFGGPLAGMAGTIMFALIGGLSTIGLVIYVLGLYSYRRNMRDEKYQKHSRT